MAEICYDVPTTNVVKRVRPSLSLPSELNSNSRAARRRRIELRRIKLGRQCFDTNGGNSTSSSAEPPTILAPERPESRPKFGFESVCGRRREMEDEVCVRVNFSRRDGFPEGNSHHFYGVFDGHGCSHVAASCRDRMHEVVGEEIEAIRMSVPTEESWRFVMERSFLRMDAEVSTQCSSGRSAGANCRCELRLPECEHVGSTAVVAIVNSTKIVVANCGDSRAVLCRRGVAVPLSVDHKPDRPDEQQRIEAAGGRVIHWDGARVLGVLAMSRAIGDGYLKPYVISEPEVTVTERTAGDEFLILASDGLWDVVSNEMACGIVRMCLRGYLAEGAATSSSGDVARESDEEANKACSDAAALLTRVATARGSGDNISVVIVDLRRRSS